jgi:hypothetical protein
VVNRRVAVKDLEQEQVDRGHRVEQAGPPGMLDLSTDLHDGGSVEVTGGVLLEAAKDANNPVMHRKTSCAGCREATPSWQEVLLCSSRFNAWL